MDVSALNNQAGQLANAQNGGARAVELAEARRQANQRHAKSAEAARARSAQELAETREAVARALGANTRLSIARSENASMFVYRAIDVDSGKVVNEWPQEQFLALIKGVREDVRTDVETTGLILDNEA